MGKVKIDIDEFARLTRIENNYWMLLSALDDAMTIKMVKYDCEEKPTTYEKFDDDTIMNALHLIERDEFESLYQRKLADAEADFAEREMKRQEGEEDVSE